MSTLETTTSFGSNTILVLLGLSVSTIGKDPTLLSGYDLIILIAC